MENIRSRIRPDLLQCLDGYHFRKIIGISNLEEVYGHRKIEFVTVNQNYGGGKIVFHRSVVKVLRFRGTHCPILKSLSSPIVEGSVRSGRYPASISPVRLSGRTEVFLSGAPLT